MVIGRVDNQEKAYHALSNREQYPTYVMSRYEPTLCGKNTEIQHIMLQCLKQVEKLTCETSVSPQ